jgi:hypothetical protein
LAHAAAAGQIGRFAMNKLLPPREMRWQEGALFTLGHSILPIESFMAVLRAYGIERLVDIRTMPRSRHNPQFNDTALAASLENATHYVTSIAAATRARRFLQRAEGSRSSREAGTIRRARRDMQLEDNARAARANAIRATCEVSP